MFRNLFGKAPFAKVAGFDPSADGWETGIMALDNLLALESNKIPGVTRTLDHSLECLEEACPEFGAVLRLEPETLGHAMGVMVILYNHVRSIHQVHKKHPKTNSIIQAFNLMSARIQTEELGEISESDAISLFAKHTIAILNGLPVLTGLLLRRFPEGPNQKLGAAVSKVITKKAVIAPDVGFLNVIYMDSISALESWMGRDPAKNPVILEKQQFCDMINKAMERAKQGAHFINLEIFDSIKEAKKAGKLFPSELYGDRILDLSPSARAEFLVDVVRLRGLLETDPAWKQSDLVWHNVPVVNLQFASRLYRSFSHGDAIDKITKRKLDFSPDQALLVLNYVLEAPNTPIFRMSFQFARSIARSLDAGHGDLVERIQKRHWPDKTKTVLIDALQGNSGKPVQQDDIDKKARRLITDTRKALTDIIIQLPDLWLKLPSKVVAGAWEDSVANDWSTLNWQLHPYHAETVQYATSIIYALREGLDVTKDIADLTRLHDHAQNNLRKIEAGEGVKYDLAKAGVKDENLRGLGYRIPTPFMHPWHTRSILGIIDKIQPSEVIVAEQRKLAKLGDFIALLQLYTQNSGWIEFEKISVPPKTGSRPSAAWMKKVKAAFKPDLQTALITRLRAHSPGTQTVTYWEMPGGINLKFDITEQNIIRGLLWAAHLCDPQKTGPVIVDFVMACFVTVPGVGIKAEKLGNAGMWALENMADGGGAPYLARILSRTRYPKVRKRIDESLNIAAKAANMSRIELDEITAPDHDLATGQRRIEFTTGAALISVEGSKVHLGWENAEGKLLKSPSKAMVEAEPDEIKDAKALKKEIEKDIATQSRWLESLYLKDRKTSYPVWRDRYVDHGTTGLLARRLLWLASWKDRQMVVLATVDGCLDVKGQVVDCRAAQMSLWHPVMSDEATVLAWRERVMEIELLQPFKQAWREVYFVTGAERTTATYSNRFAGHILRQHQMMTLAHLNAWKCTHRMWVDAANDEPSHIQIPEYELYAEFWTEGAGGDDPPVLDSSAYIYITSDRVKFHHLNPKDPYGRGEVLEIDSIPAIIFSEVMRHCDLFTSIASISIDPEWIDRGADAEHPNQWRRDEADAYWNRQLTADLGVSAQTRHAILAEILPRLQMGKSRFSLQKNHLMVRGDKRKYLIHLGSGAVIRESDGCHICIVKARNKGPKIFLPFEGDATLSVILSKAFLLADDSKITDPVILQQL